MGFTPFQAGLAFLPMTASSFVAGTLIAPRLLTRLAAAELMLPGFILAACGMAVLTQLQSASNYWSGILPAEILLGLGIACVMMPAANVATSRLEPHTAGLASAALNSAQQLGASLGTGILNAVATSATGAYLAMGGGASQPAALVHGYATAALWAAALLLLGALVATAGAPSNVER
jgi:hypothetical protein